MELRITINLSNAAFEDPREIPRILSAVAEQHLAASADTFTRGQCWALIDLAQ